jgi:uncharacterized heparinase superfamily protein
MSIGTLLRTISHLKPSQIASQVRCRVRRSFESPKSLTHLQPPAFPGCVWNPREPFLPPVGNNPAEAVKSGRLVFLNHPVEIGWPPDWNRGNLPALWRYNLQYLEFLWELRPLDAQSAAQDWVQQHGPDRGRIGWEPYPTSLRLINLCALFFGRDRIETDRRPDVRDALWASIFRQMTWLSRHLETHLLANHLLENAAAMTVVGSCFGGDDAKQWRAAGIKLLADQLAEQMLQDGGHFERSPMYQCRVLYVLRLLNAIDDELAGMVEKYLDAGIAALARLTHPDGRIALLNDSAIGIYPELARLSQATALPIGAFELPQTGYFGSRTADGNYIVCDAGPIGPDYQPGHAHGDMLSFELSLRGHRLIVDSGVLDYVRGETRQYCRSTRAHNTVEIDGLDQCEFWDVFRVGRRGRIRDAAFAQTAAGFALTAWHDGYMHLPGRPVHMRHFRWHDRGELVIDDQITAGGSHRAISRLHLHPDCRATRRTKNEIVVEYPAGRVIVSTSEKSELNLEDSLYCPQFGQKLKNQSIALSVAFSGETNLTLRIHPES